MNLSNRYSRKHLTAGEKEYTYNARGQQVAYSDGTTTATYAYNPSGLRSAKTVGGSTKYFVYNGMQIVFEYEDSIASGTTYYYGLNRTHSSDGDVYVYNAHGDTVQLVNGGSLSASYTYDAFGNLLTSVGNSDNPFLYCSEYFDSETETYYLRARYYNPANGRFTQEDPIRDGLNWYTYCACNPVMYVDPSGLVVTLPGITSLDDERFVNLQLLTDDTLEVDLETGIVSYIPSDTVEREVGTNLVRELIDNKKSCDIEFTPEKAYMAGHMQGPGGYIFKYIVSINPTYTPDLWTYVEGEGYSMRKIPAFIALGHELIHILRDLKGESVGFDRTAYYLGGPQPGKTLLRSEAVEELSTVGIDYTIVDNNNWTNTTFVSASANYYTENSLRLENDRVNANVPGYIPLGRRAAY